MGSRFARTLRKRALKNPKADTLAPARGQHSTIGRCEISIFCFLLPVVCRGRRPRRPGNPTPPPNSPGEHCSPLRSLAHWYCRGGGLPPPRCLARLQNVLFIVGPDSLSTRATTHADTRTQRPPCVKGAPPKAVGDCDLARKSTYPRNITIPPSRLRRATSLYTREALRVVRRGAQCAPVQLNDSARFPGRI